MYVKFKYLLDFFFFIYLDQFNAAAPNLGEVKAFYVSDHFSRENN